LLESIADETHKSQDICRATMAPASTLKRPKRGVRKTKGGAGRKQTQTASDDNMDPVATPYKKPYDWNDCDSANTTDSEDEGVDPVEVVSKVTKRKRGNRTTSVLGNNWTTAVLYDNIKDTIETLQESVVKLQTRNQMLARQIKNITKMGGVDKYEQAQIRKMVKEDLFKRVKFITTTAMEAKCMQYLSNKLNVPTETQREWIATYAHCVRDDDLNNKRNNVSQDLKLEIKGKQGIRKKHRVLEPTLLIRIIASSYTAILGEQGTKELQAKAFVNIREPTNLLQQDYFNLFFDRPIPCVAAKKVWTSKDKIACAITDGGKISVTDKAFTELCLLNYWDKWSENKPAKWTDSRQGNCSFKGWSNDAYHQFDSICKRIRAQRETDASKAMEVLFLDYAIKQNLVRTPRGRSGYF
jgi:hypothetical protein